MQAHFGSHWFQALHRKWVAPIQALIVEKGCSTVSRRTAIASPIASMRTVMASTILSCSQRLTRRSLLVVHWFFSGQAGHAVHQ